MTLSGAMDDMLRASGSGPKRKRTRSRGTRLVADLETGTYRRKPGRPRAMTELGRGTFITRDRDLVKATREAVETIWGQDVITSVRSARLAPRSRTKLYTLVWRIMVPKYDRRSFDQSSSQDTPGFVETFRVEP